MRPVATGLSLPGRAAWTAICWAPLAARREMLSGLFCIKKLSVVDVVQLTCV